MGELKNIQKALYQLVARKQNLNLIKMQKYMFIKLTIW